MPRLKQVRILMQIDHPHTRMMKGPDWLERQLVRGETPA